MRYIAKQRGFAGRLVEAGEEFDFDGPKGSWMEEVGGEEDELEDELPGDGPTRDQIKAALDALGVQYNVRAGTEALRKLLEMRMAQAEQ